MAANSRYRVLYPLYSLRKAGFPRYGWKRGLATPRPSAAVPTAFDAGPAALSYLVRGPGVSNPGCAHSMGRSATLKGVASLVFAAINPTRRTT
jgi:hypothetical protein